MTHHLFHHLRTDYQSNHLLSKDLPENPLAFFRKWFKEAIEDEIPEPNAFALSTVDSESSPHTRIVLLKEVRENGIVFYTNYDSLKGNQIKENNNVSACFFWPKQFRQIRMRGFCIKISPEDSDAYFNSRPLKSRIGAIASPQSQEITSREWLIDQIENISGAMSDEPKRPPNWGGYEIQPVQYEFWQGQRNRLHDRFQYNLINDQWILKRLAP